jgi:hypothetical protein
MSKEEVMRKLTEIKKLYGGSPGGVLDIEVNQIEEVSDADQTGSSALEKVKRKFAASPDHADREQSELGDPGPADSFGFSFDLSDDGAQGSEIGTQNKP